MTAHIRTVTQHMCCSDKCAHESFLAFAKREDVLRATSKMYLSEAVTKDETLHVFATFAHRWKTLWAVTSRELCEHLKGVV